MFSTGGGNRALAPAQAVKMTVVIHLVRTPPVMVGVQKKVQGAAVGQAQKRVRRAAVDRAQTPAAMRVNQTILQVEPVLTNHPAARLISPTTLQLYTCFLWFSQACYLLPPTCFLLYLHVFLYW